MAGHAAQRVTSLAETDVVPHRSPRNHIKSDQRKKVEKGGIVIAYALVIKDFNVYWNWNLFGEVVWEHKGRVSYMMYHCRPFTEQCLKLKQFFGQDVWSNEFSERL